ENAGFRLVARRKLIDRNDGEHQRQHGRNDDPAALVRQRAAERARIEITAVGDDARGLVDDGRCRWGTGRRLLRGRLGYRPLHRRLRLVGTPERQTHHTLPRTLRLYLNVPDYTPLRLRLG